MKHRSHAFVFHRSLSFDVDIDVDVDVRLAPKVRSIKVTLHGKNLGVPEMAGPMSAAVIKGALNLLLAQEVSE